MKKLEPDASELINPESPELSDEQSDWPDEIFVNPEDERKELNDEERNLISFLLDEGREFGW
jgi:hypothetical protein